MYITIKLQANDTSKLKKFDKIFSENVSDSKKYKILKDLGFTNEEASINVSFSEDLEGWNAVEKNIALIKNGGLSKDDKTKMLASALEKSSEPLSKTIEVWNSNEISLTSKNILDSSYNYEFELSSAVDEVDFIRFSKSVSKHIDGFVTLSICHEDSLDCEDEYSFTKGNETTLQEGAAEKIDIVEASTTITLFEKNTTGTFVLGGLLSLGYLLITSSISWWAYIYVFLIVILNAVGYWDSANQKNRLIRRLGFVLSALITSTFVIGFCDSNISLLLYPLYPSMLIIGLLSLAVNYWLEVKSGFTKNMSHEDKKLFLKIAIGEKVFIAPSYIMGIVTLIN